MPKGLSPAARVMAFFSSATLPEAEIMYDLVKETMKVRRDAELPNSQRLARRSHKKPSATPPISEATPLGTPKVKRPRRTHAQMVQDALVGPQSTDGLGAPVG